LSIRSPRHLSKARPLRACIVQTVISGTRSFQCVRLNAI
jgi:hypothetical protein